MLVELGSVQANRLVEGGAAVVVQVHGDVHRQAEEAGPQLGLPVVDQLGPGLQHSGEEVAVAVLVLAPVLKVLEQGVQLVVGVALQVAVNADVAPVANLLRQVGGVDDELGLEEGVLAVLGQEAQVLSIGVTSKGKGRMCQSAWGAGALAWRGCACRCCVNRCTALLRSM